MHPVSVAALDGQPELGYVVDVEAEGAEADLCDVTVRDTESGAHAPFAGRGLEVRGAPSRVTVARGLFLRNRAGERFMEQYSPTLLDLAPRDIVARSIVTEIRAGRGVLGDGSAEDYVHLDATHLGREAIDELQARWQGRAARTRARNADELLATVQRLAEAMRRVPPVAPMIATFPAEVTGEIPAESR